jgi:hypothetical protein
VRSITLPHQQVKQIADLRDERAERLLRRLVRRDLPFIKTPLRSHIVEFSIRQIEKRYGYLAPPDVRNMETCVQLENRYRAMLGI